MIQFNMGAQVITLDEAVRGLRLLPAADGARVELTVRARTSQATGPASQLSATLRAGRQTHQGLVDVGELRANNLLQSSLTDNSLTFVGYAGAALLRAVEETRRSGDLYLVLDVRAQSVDGNPLGLVDGFGSALTIGPMAEEWVTQLERVTASSHVDIMIPVTSDPELAVQASRVCKARDLIRDGEFVAAAGELRQVLEMIRLAYDVAGLMKSANTKAQGDRTPLERWAFVVQDRFKWLSAFAHDDSEFIKGATMTRGEAMDALSEVAGKLHRLAADRRDGLV